MGTNDIEELVELVGNPKWFPEGAVIAEALREQDIPNAEAVYIALQEQVRAFDYQFTEVAGPQPTTLGRTNYARREVEVAPGPAYRKAVTLAHELGHVAAGPMSLVLFPESWRETLAESVAFLVAKTLGWPTTSMQAYLTHAAGPENLDALRVALRSLAPLTLGIASRLVDDAGLLRFAA